MDGKKLVKVDAFKEINLQTEDGFGYREYSCGRTSEL